MARTSQTPAHNDPAPATTPAPRAKPGKKRPGPKQGQKLFDPPVNLKRAMEKGEGGEDLGQFQAWRTVRVASSTAPTTVLPQGRAEAHRQDLQPSLSGLPPGQTYADMQGMSCPTVPWPTASAVGDVVPPLSSQSLPGSVWVHNPEQITDNRAAQAALLQRGCEWTGPCTSTAHVDFCHQQPTASPSHPDASLPPAWGEWVPDATAAWFPQPGVGGRLLPSQSARSHVDSHVGPHRHHQASRSARMAGARAPYGRADTTTTHAADEVVLVGIDELLARYAPSTNAHQRWAFWTQQGYGTYCYNAGSGIWYWYP